MKKLSEKNKRQIKYNNVYMASDFFITFIFVLVSFVSFYGYQEFANHIPHVFIYTTLISIVTVVLFYVFRIYKFIIGKNIGMLESLRVSIVTFIVHLAGFIVISSIPAYSKEFAYSANYVWSWFLCVFSLMFVLSSSRFVLRAININKILSLKKEGVRTLVIGAGATGRVVIDEARRNKDYHNKIVAFIDDDPNKIGGMFSNIPVKGPMSEVGTVIDFYNIEEVVIAISDISEEDLHKIIEQLSPYPVRVRRMPTIAEMQGPNDVRMINVDLNDLLSRDPISLDNHEVNDMLHERTVLVTGAGGSIGSELVRQIFNTHPRTLILFDIYENSTYEIQMELTRRMREEHIHDIELVTLIGSTYNEFRVEQIIKRYRPEYIYHAAAYKHVPLMEDSPAEAIRTNVIGTYNVAKMAAKYRVKKMVLVSTDKAVRPTNVMGATKRFAETIIQYFSRNCKTTAYAAVRFGNVLGSNGSVVPLFKKKIEAGGPVTITDKRIIRYFMTIPEAVSLILQCGLFAKGGEVFILDMGKPVKILHLAEKLIRQAGYMPYTDIEIVETGLRPGEKLYEELLLDVTTQTKTENKKIFIEKRERRPHDTEEEIKTISQVFQMEETTQVKQLLAQIIDTYQITENKKR